MKKFKAVARAKLTQKTGLDQNKIESSFGVNLHEAKQRNFLFREERVAPATGDDGNEKVQSCSPCQIDTKNWT